MGIEHCMEVVETSIQLQHERGTVVEACAEAFEGAASISARPAKLCRLQPPPTSIVLSFSFIWFPLTSSTSTDLHVVPPIFHKLPLILNFEEADGGYVSSASVHGSSGSVHGSNEVSMKVVDAYLEWRKRTWKS